ncbi:putative leader peptide [Sphaerisporangium krabiense]
MTSTARRGHSFHATVRRHIDLARVSSALCRPVRHR